MYIDTYIYIFTLNLLAGGGQRKDAEPIQDATAPKR